MPTSEWNLKLSTLGSGSPPGSKTSQAKKEARDAPNRCTPVEALPKGPEVVPFWDYLNRILNMSHKKELLKGLWVHTCGGST